MTRAAFIERVRRLIYNGPPSDDATITVGLVNNYLGDAIATAVKTNYKENIAIDGIQYINDSFYITYTDRAIIASSGLTWKISLPEIPVGVGSNKGISVLKIKDSDGSITLPLIPISQDQRTYFDTMRPVPNKIIYYYEGSSMYVKSSIILSAYTADVTMVSGGDSTNLSSELNVPPDYLPVMMDYLVKHLLLERSQPVDAQNDGLDAITTT